MAEEKAEDEHPAIAAEEGEAESSGDDFGYGRPLTVAVKANDLEATRALLQAGERPMFVPILAGGGPCNMSRPMMDLLAEFNALPEGASFATFQLVLYAMGSSHIHPREVWRGPDL